MMNVFRKLLFFVFFLLLLTGCGDDAAPPVPDSPPPEATTTAAPSDDSGSIQNTAEEAAALLDELAGKSAGPHLATSFFNLNVIPKTVSAGEEIRFESDFPADAVLQPAGDLLQSGRFSDGAGTILISDGTPDGLYVVMLEAESKTVAWATIRVASTPGIWLQVDRAFRAADAPAYLMIQSHQLPEGSLAALYVTEEDAGEAVPYIPDENGVLRPGLPISAADIVGRRLMLPGNISGTLQVIAGPDDFETPESPGESFRSTPRLLGICPEDSLITGDAGSAAIVNAVWLEGGIRSRSTSTQDGKYQLSVRPGNILLQIFPENGPSSRTWLAVGCGEAVEMAGIAGGGQIAATHSANRSTAALGPFSSPYLFAPGLQTGGDEICRNVVVAAGVSAGGEEQADIADAAAAALKTAISMQAPRVSVVTYADVRALLEEAARAMLAGDEEAAQQAMDLAAAATQADFLVNLRAATIGNTVAAAVSGIPLLEGDAQVHASGTGSENAIRSPGFNVYQELAEKLSHAAICGEVQPEDTLIDTGETVSLAYRLSDLAGEEIESAAVRVSDPVCGELDPDAGSTESGIFETKYTYPDDDNCIENLDFSAEWSGPAGGVKTRTDEAVAHISPQPVMMDLYAGYAAGVSGDANLAGAILLHDEKRVSTVPGGGLPAIYEGGDCKYLEGGMPLEQQFWRAHTEFSGHRAEGVLSVFNLDDYSLGYTVPESDRPLPEGRQLRFSTRAVAIPVEDDGVARSATGFSGNFTDILSSGGIASTVFLFDIRNPSLLPKISPQIVWQSQVSNDGGGYNAFLFYKVINCGTDAGLDNLQSFFSVNAQFLTSFAEDEAGELSGSVILPEITEERYQILLYVITTSGAGSIKETSDGLYHSAISRMQIDLLVNFVQESGGEE